jgi:hypothetical protein
VIDLLLAIDVEGLVGVDADAHLADVGVDEAGRVPALQVGQEALHGDLRQKDKVPDADLKRKGNDGIPDESYDRRFSVFLKKTTILLSLFSAYLHAI